MKAFLLILFVFISGCGSQFVGGSSYSAPLFVIQAELDEGVAVTLEGAASFGTGFFTSPRGDAYTAAHVVADDSYNYFALFQNGERLPVRVVELDLEKDVARLSLNPGSRGVFSFFELGGGGFVLGESYQAMGMTSRDYEFDIVKGEYDGSSFSFKVEEGMSGGPIMNLEGEIVGLIRGYSKETLRSYGVSFGDLT